MREPDAEVDDIARRVIGTAIEVHQTLVPGFLEVTDEKALAIELRMQRITVNRQHPVNLIYKGYQDGREVRTDLHGTGYILLESNQFTVGFTDKFQCACPEARYQTSSKQPPTIGCSKHLASWRSNKDYINHKFKEKTKMVNTRNPEARAMTEEADFLKINAIDHVHLYVGNAKQAMYWWWKGFGFKPVAYSGLETGNRKYASYVLESGKIRLVVSAAYKPTSEIAAHHLLHGDGVKVVALGVDDAAVAYEATTSRGAVGEWTLREETDQYGTLRTAAIKTYGETLHMFVDRSDYDGPFMPGYEPLDMETDSVGLAAVDHIVGNVELGKMNDWVKFYHEVMGFRQLLHFDDKDISTEYSALMSKVMQNGNGRVKLPINEPADGKRKSQIEEYLDFYMTPGVQHLALSTGDILGAVEKLKRNGIEFLRVPDTYYDMLPERLKGVNIKQDLEKIKDLGILVDHDDEGYLLQIFSKPLQDRPTMFIEVIERHGSRGFGKGNFKALFEALETEQDRRGNL
jgi:4-hydroxyphenylpyruvate dioxygenase